MPLIRKKMPVEVIVAHRCDRCGKHDPNRCNDFAIEHTFGFDSAADMTRVEAALCDDCLLELLLDHVPGAVFKNEHGKRERRDALRRALENKRRRQKELRAAIARAERQKAAAKRHQSAKRPA